MALLWPSFDRLRTNRCYVGPKTHRFVLSLSKDGREAPAPPERMIVRANTV